VSTNRRAKGSPQRSTRKPKPASPARSAGAAAAPKKASAVKGPSDRAGAKPPARISAKAVASAKPDHKAAKRPAAVPPKATTPPKATLAKPPAFKAPLNGKSRQLAASTKSDIEMKAKPEKASAAKSSSPAVKAASAVKGKATQTTIVLPENYQPSDAEPFMSTLQRYYFKLKLLSWKEDILRQTRETLQGMVDDTLQYADLADRATSETDRALELRARDRQRKLIAKIDAALARIEDGTYGYCEETGEPIGLKRLDARPIATLSLEAQERHERRERVHRGD